MPRSPSSPLLQPLRLGPAELPNRIVFGAHVTNFGVGNVFTPRHFVYYRERAAGGAGLIVTEALTVHPLDWPYEHIPFGHRDEIVPSLRALVREVRSASGGATPLVAQLSHTGGQTHGRMLRQSPWAPSAVPDVSSRKMPRVMEADQIEQVVEGFGRAAERVAGMGAAGAGLDGVEVNAAQYSLLRQFLSPLTNFRTDDYGGSLENRMRLLLRVVAGVRAALGAERILGVKLTGDELAPWGGLTPEHAAEIARKLVAAGGVDYLSVQIGGPFSAHITDAGMPMPAAHGAAASALIRAAVRERGVPVFLEGRIDRVETAEAVLRAGQAEAVVMTRALISDPELPRKVAEPGRLLRDAGFASSSGGRSGSLGTRDPSRSPEEVPRSGTVSKGVPFELIRPQVGMNRYFVVKGDWNRPLGDLANPRAGREETLPPVEPLPEGQLQRVLVIGGGPAGLEAAGTLARLGHRVVLAEAHARLGGLAVLLAEAVTARAEFAPLVAYHERMLERLGVEVRLHTAIRADEPWLAEFERIFVATGAAAPPPPFEVPPGMPLWTPRALLEADAPQRLPAPSVGRALVIDSEFGYRMANAVERLLALGFGVDVMAEDFFIGREVVESAELLWFSRVAPAGVGLFPRLRVARVEADADAVVTVDRFSKQERRFAPVNLVVWAAPEIPDEGLPERLRAVHPNVVTIGDARAPRLMGEAILHAHRTVRGM